MRLTRILKRMIRIFKNKKMTKVLLLFVCLIVIVNFSKGYIDDHIALDSQQVEFIRPVDGDTAHFLIGDEDVTVRFLAIDTPETVKPGVKVQPFGKEASNFTEQTLKNAKNIRLEYEESNKIDKYDRSLAYVFVDEKLLQEELLLKGYAKMSCFCDGYRYSSILKAAEAYAQEKKLGLWSHKR